LNCQAMWVGVCGGRQKAGWPGEGGGGGGGGVGAKPKVFDEEKRSGGWKKKQYSCRDPVISKDSVGHQLGSQTTPNHYCNAHRHKARRKTETFSSRVRRDLGRGHARAKEVLKQEASTNRREMGSGELESKKAD